MQEELLQLKMQKVWVLVDLPHGERAIGTKWVFRNKKDERGIVIRNKARLVAQGHTQEKGINYEDVFAPVASIEAIRLFLAYASFMGFIVYVKSAFLYGTIEEEVYVCQPTGFEDPDYPDKVYKVVKIDQTLFIKRQKGDILLVQIYVDDIIFGATNKDLCKSFKKLMKDKFQMSLMGELTFFLGLQVKEKDGIFISQDKYVAEILRKFRLTEGKSASTLIDIEKPLLKDPDGEDVDVHTYRSMIGSLMYLTSSRPDIMFVVNEVTRLQALVDKKKIVVTEATIREALHLGDEEGVDCLPNEEIFTELARTGYKKPSTKLTFYKAFFSSQWKFLIHTILQCMSAKRTSWNEISSSMAYAVICLSSGRKFNFSKYIFNSLARNVDSTTKFYMYPRFLQLIIRKQVGDLSTHTTKYTSPALTQKVFVNMRRVEVNAGDAAEGDVSAAHGEVPIVQPTPPQLLQVQPPSPQPQPHQAAEFPMNLLQVMDACAALTRRVEHLEFDKVAQALEITKLKRRVKKLERRNTVRKLKFKWLQRDDAVVLEDDKEEDKEVVDAVKDVEEAKEDETEPAKVQEVVDVVTTAKLITKVVTAASETVTAASAIITIVEAQVPAATLTAAPARVAAAPSRRRKGVVIRDPELESTTSTIIPVKTKSKDQGKGILVEEPKPLKKKQQIEQDEQYARELYAELNKNINWDEVINHVKIKAKEDPTMDYFKGMSYDDIRPIFEAKFNSNVAFLLKTKEQIEEDENKALQKLNETPVERVAKRRKLDEEVEELKRHLQIVPNKDDDVYTKATPLAQKVLVVDYHIIEMNNKPYYKIIRADDTHQLYVSFLILLRNFDREDLKALWSLVKERFSITKPKNFSDDFLLVTLGAMFEKLDIHAQIWKNQRTVHGLAKVKGWKLLESCGVQIITFTSTQLILLVKRKYPLTRFTLDQMLNVVRLEVEEESEVSLELLRFIRQQHQEGHHE
nr:retrovirus-related Pol polyprotein from transposon TNT 1-94 [Tanacetum cinerariifolium]